MYGIFWLLCCCSLCLCSLYLSFYEINKKKFVYIIFEVDSDFICFIFFNARYVKVHKLLKLYFNVLFSLLAWYFITCSYRHWFHHNFSMVNQQQAEELVGINNMLHFQIKSTWSDRIESVFVLIFSLSLFLQYSICFRLSWALFHSSKHCYHMKIV